MKRTFPSKFEFECSGILSTNDIFLLFCKGWMNFLQGIFFGINLSSNLKWVACVDSVKVRHIKYDGMPERGNVEIKIQTTISFDGKNKEYTQSDKNEETETAKKEVTNIVRVSAELYEKTFLIAKG